MSWFPPSHPIYAGLSQSEPSPLEDPDLSAFTRLKQQITLVSNQTVMERRKTKKSSQGETEKKKAHIRNLKFSANPRSKTYMDAIHFIKPICRCLTLNTMSPFLADETIAAHTFRFGGASFDYAVCRKIR